MITNKNIHKLINVIAFCMRNGFFSSSSAAATAADVVVGIKSACIQISYHCGKKSIIHDLDGDICNRTVTLAIHREKTVFFCSKELGKTTWSTNMCNDNIDSIRFAHHLRLLDLIHLRTRRF